MKLAVPFLAAKPARGGAERYYWQPSPALRRAGWKTVALGGRLSVALAEARRMNGLVAVWRQGEAVSPAPSPRAARQRVERFARRETVRHALRRWQAEEWSGLAANTREKYRSATRVIDDWAGDQALGHITPQRCEVLLRELARPVARGGAARLHRAQTIGQVLRTFLGWAERRELVDGNAMDKVRIRGAPPRQQVWSDAAIEAFGAMARAMGWPSMAAAVELAADTAQREADLLALGWSQLHTPAGGGRRYLRLRQGKTGRWVDVPLTARLDALLAGMEAANRARAMPATTILLRETDGRPYSRSYFGHLFAGIRAAAVAGSAAHGLAPAPELEALQYRDLRRTMIVRLGEAEVDLPGIAALSGHQIEVCKDILEVYLPRTRKMADAAIVRLEAHRAPRAHDRNEA